MKFLHAGLFVFILSGMSGCASDPINGQYYSLVLAADVTTTAGVADKNPVTRLIVGPIQLARYLDEPGLALQTGSNQMRFANQHLWAEPLDEAIGKVLVRDISQHVDTVAVDRAAGRWTGHGDCQLRIEFDRFHATENSQVVTTGRYWIYENNSNDVSKNEFDIVRVLSADGYAHAVDQLRFSLETLAGQIVEHMANNTVCLTKKKAAG